MWAVYDVSSVSGLFKYKRLESFCLHCCSADEGLYTPLALNTLFHNLTTFSPLLHTLVLHIGAVGIEVTCDNVFWPRFPHLRVLSLDGFILEHPELAAEFWSFHSNLEQVELLSPRYTAGSYFEGVLTGTFPRLTSLKAPFADVCMLMPILGDQLVNLTILKSINAQVPYLLRSVLPNGLGSLRSLGIHQEATKHSKEILREGGQWHEDEHGNIREISISKRKAARFFDAPYIMSLARGAPNLEDLELIGSCKPPIGPIATSLSMFFNLKRLYLSGEGNTPFIPYETRRSLLEDARDIADGCAHLESVTEITREEHKNVHLSAKIRRSEDGVLALYEKPGCGRVIGLEDNDYPGFL